MGRARRLMRMVRAPLRRGLETNHDIARTVFLAGSGRSGTTWLSEIINADRSFRYMFEPFNPRKTPEWQAFAFHQYIHRHSRNDRALNAAAAILSGRVHNDWVDSQNRTLIASRRLVKDIRANLMLGWLKENFPRMRMVLLVRHPLAIAASRMKLGWGPQTLDSMREQEHLVRDFLTPHLPALGRWAGDNFSMHIANWCVQYQVPLTELRQDEFCLVSYEALVADADSELPRLFDYLRLPLTAIHRGRLGVASATASGQTRREVNRQHLLRPWGSAFDKERIHTMEEIVSAFGLTALLERCCAY